MPCTAGSTRGAPREAPSSRSEAGVPPPALTPDQKQGLLRDGYTAVPGAVSAALRDEALRAINASIGRGIDPAQVETYRARSFCPELQREPVVTDLFQRSEARGLAESLLGRLEPVKTGQIALAFPGPPRPAWPHIDGLYSPRNGVPKGSVLSFTILVGVMLSDVPQPDCGNLVVWPGTHLTLEEHFRRRGPRSLLEGMPEVPMPEPRALTGRAGDLVLCHYQLAHGGGANVSPHVRYAVYFRVKAAGHDGRRWECLTDLWREWPGLRA
jgi:hypothetical protein